VTLGNEISKKRVETFILTCVDALGHIDTTNYHLFLREIGDAVLLLFSSFSDVYQWWFTMNSWLSGRDNMWMAELDLSGSEQKQFRLECKTIIHAGEIDYSGGNVPVSAAVNQVFKVEKLFRPHELGITKAALTCARPSLRSCKLRPVLRGDVSLPGDSEPMGVYVIDNYCRILRAKQRRVTQVIEDRKRQGGESDFL
jgi:class 3 adenylate cyclase